MNKTVYASRRLFFTDKLFGIGVVAILPIYGNLKDVPEDERETIRVIEMEEFPEE